jgi:hypothetical protein
LSLLSEFRFHELAHLWLFSPFSFLYCYYSCSPLPFFSLLLFWTSAGEEPRQDAESPPNQQSGYIRGCGVRAARLNVCALRADFRARLPLTRNKARTCTRSVHTGVAYASQLTTLSATPAAGAPGTKCVRKFALVNEEEKRQKEKEKTPYSNSGYALVRACVLNTWDDSLDDDALEQQVRTHGGAPLAIVLLCLLCACAYAHECVFPMRFCD